MRKSLVHESAAESISAPKRLAELVEEFKKGLVVREVMVKDGNQSEAARSLGVHRNTVNRIMTGR